MVKVFIGSSVEGLAAAKALARCLEYHPLSPTLWCDAGFKLTNTPIESLEEILSQYPFGAFLFTGHDIVRIRKSQYLAPRDNVVFELGLWIGRWGRSHCFVITPKGRKLRIPTDLEGITPGTFTEPSETAAVDDWSRALRGVSDRIADRCGEVSRSMGLHVRSSWLWSDFVQSRTPPVIAVCNPALLRRKITGDREKVVTRLKDVRYVWSGQYTGLGETESVGRLYHVFAKLGATHLPFIAASTEVTSSQLKTPLILLGGLGSNRIAEEILVSGSLPFQMRRNGVSVGRKVFRPSGYGAGATDYAVLLRTFNPYNPRAPLILCAGYHSFGTAAAVEYATQSTDVPQSHSDGSYMALLEVLCRGSARLFPKVIATRSW